MCLVFRQHHANEEESFVVQQRQRGCLGLLNQMSVVLRVTFA